MRENEEVGNMEKSRVKKRIDNNIDGIKVSEVSDAFVERLIGDSEGEDAASQKECAAFTDEEKIEITARRILSAHKAAFEELGK